jgi:hypothetical protein
MLEMNPDSLCQEEMKWSGELSSDVTLKLQHFRVFMVLVPNFLSKDALPICVPPDLFTRNRYTVVPSAIGPEFTMRRRSNKTRDKTRG